LKKPKLLIANGVNLDLLGTREVEIYGGNNLQSLEALIKSKVNELAKIAGFEGCDLNFFQSNDEALFLETLSKGWDGAIINPAAWTHTSLALADRLKAIDLPFVEVHISNLAQREEFRKHSHTACHAKGVVYGLGFDSYLSGLLGLLLSLKS
jgi:3-dehydroquinate dehydratase II